MSNMLYEASVEKWGIFEVRIKGKNHGNPFVDYALTGHFTSKNEQVSVSGFYDGEGNYAVRFMPSFEESYTFRVEGSFSDEIYEGAFDVSAPAKDNHGPVRVSHKYHFAYEDGTPYYSIGTTCYVWTHQDQTMQEKTLETLKNSGFNKIRFCILPKHYDYNLNEPITYPFEGTPCDNSVLTKENFNSYNGNAPGNDWDFERFNPEHFQLIEKRIGDLMSLGIQADLIVMHPYDRWGFSQMEASVDDRYWQYVIARFAAYRNVWWSLANEYDLMTHKGLKDWERYAQIVCSHDPYNHLRSIHNCGPFYDYKKPWITHCSIQRQDIYKTAECTDEWRQIFGKPIVLDEIAYEGDIQHGWGNISGQEMVRRFWEATVRGGYAGHGETYQHPEDILWWSHGGELHGESGARLKFLATVLEDIPAPGLKPMTSSWDDHAATVEGLFSSKGYYLYYYSFNRPSFRDFSLNESKTYTVEVIDTWEMTIEERGRYKGKFRIELPGKEYMAIRIKEVEHEV